ncbi:hypothetical protein EU527_11565 [Candidatus Thorarchaeota archaeon]|nr:MAG: hypothetical protein EU527_11565 [Candidatus Thorarchaeota archaeon]
MIMVNVLTNLWVVPKNDGDIRLRNGGTQKFLAVVVHSTMTRDRSRATSRIRTSFDDTRVILLT